MNGEMWPLERIAIVSRLIVFIISHGYVLCGTAKAVLVGVINLSIIKTVGRRTCPQHKVPQYLNIFRGPPRTVLHPYQRYARCTKYEVFVQFVLCNESPYSWQYNSTVQREHETRELPYTWVQWSQLTNTFNNTLHRLDLIHSWRSVFSAELRRSWYPTQMVSSVSVVR